MSWLYYLLEANLYLLAFYAFYRLFLQHETFYTSNRYYLLLTSLASFILPILQLGLLKPTPGVTDATFAIPVVESGAYIAAVPLEQVPDTIHYTAFLYPIYLFVAICFAFRLSIGLLKIIRLWLNAKKQRSGRIVMVELKDQAAFSFFNLLFIHPHLAEKKAVLMHEMVHIKQKHSFDILLFELLQIICWFNPIIFFLKKDVKLLHEYIADELSTDADMQKHEYAMFLIENSFGITPTALTNQIFNQSILKRRINMLNKKRTAGWARLRLLLTVPLMGGMLCVSTMAFTKDYGYVDLLPEKSEATNVLFQNEPKVEKPSKTGTAKKQTAPKLGPVKKDQVKFPPPRVSTNRYFGFIKDKKTGEIVSLEKRLIVINNRPLAEGEIIYGVEGAKSITDLTAANATKKYGERAKAGAIEFTGPNIKLITHPVEPPPPRVKVVRFPPPKVKDTLRSRTRDLKLNRDTLQRKTINLRVRPTLISRKTQRTDTLRSELLTLRIRPSMVTRKTVQLRSKPDSSRKTINLRLKTDTIRLNLKLPPTSRK